MNSALSGRVSVCGVGDNLSVVGGQRNADPT